MEPRMGTSQICRSFYVAIMVTLFRVKWKKARIINADLDDAQDICNTHVLQSKNAVTGGGRRPTLMYTLPQLYSAEDHICPANKNESKLCPKTLTCADETVFQLCTLFMEENNLSFPQDSNQANDLYIRLREWIRLGLDLL
ncbi:hypothetical protein KUTeg_003830 [Tegillarca granosa]|uniref:Uncharacterized protein n=1 Tax=Tegillarca granosa TaxID=220873 RepID=A0ABQ9FN53_TEGGR|nr:hypothetical protein KUTeg_003830 [Tegillarca granosa]